MKMKDKGKADAHVMERADLGSAVSQLGESGTMPHPRKSHDADVAWGEGFPQGAVHPAHEKHQVKDAKHVMGKQMSAQAEHERRENGGEDTSKGK